MARAKAEAAHEKVGAVLGGRGRKSREHDNDASCVTVTRETCRAEAEECLIEEIVCRANIQNTYNRAASNNGTAGVGNMAIGQLKENLQTDWSRIKEELLNGKYKVDAMRVVRGTDMEKRPKQNEAPTEIKELRI